VSEVELIICCTLNASSIDFFVFLHVICCNKHPIRQYLHFGRHQASDSSVFLHLWVHRAANSLFVALSMHQASKSLLVACLIASGVGCIRRLVDLSDGRSKRNICHTHYLRYSCFGVQIAFRGRAHASDVLVIY
jgi:hypothetical protein